MEHLKVKSFGPIEEADVHFGDLTLLVGPQASGKSIFLQLFKLLVDKKQIQKNFQQYNYIWDKETEQILELYFGEGMSKIWKKNSKIQLDEKTYEKSFLITKYENFEEELPISEETLFYIPAQRILSVADGRPKNFMEFDSSTPYVLRQFSETLRLMLQNGMGKSDSIFPMNTRLNEQQRVSYNDTIFHDGKVVMDERTGQRKLRMEVGGMSIPYMTWSAGQKEFMPLLLGFYWLYPPFKYGQTKNVKYVVIEEPEMGLHPEAIKSVILQIIDLISRNFKVIVSTHSPVLLEFVWAYNLLKNSQVTEEAFFELFDIPENEGTKGLFDGLLSKKINTYYFDRKNEKVIAKDISSLDAGSEDEAMSGWGGISSFAGKAADVVSKYFRDEK
jgi:energy-coupling factor transporter ATP-binding protein EcfA2